MDILHNRGTFLFLAFVFSLGTVGCTDEKAGDTKGQGEIVATVNGESITEGELNDYKSARPDGARMEDQKALLDELITQKVIYQDALRHKLDKEPEVLRELELVRTRVLASAAVRKAMKDNPVTEEQLQAEYDSLKDRMVAPEYKASHILVKEEDLARKIIEQLNKGADFAQLAKEHSTDTSSQNGGDLGWFNPQQMVPPFSQAASQLEKGSYTKEPVKTQFGWHIIKLEDSRKSEPPAFEELKGRLEQMLKQRQVGDYIQKVKDEAKISIKGEAEASEGENAKTLDTEKSDDSATEKSEDSTTETSEDATTETSEDATTETSEDATTETSDDSAVKESDSTDEEKTDASNTK